MNTNDETMILHNIFDATEVCTSNRDRASNFDLPQQHREEDYVQLTPISPIKLSSFVMNQETPQTEVETTFAGNDDFFIEQVIDLLQSNSDVVKFEAASSMLQLITRENAKKVLELDGIFCLAKALESSEEVVRDECAKCLNKLACISPSIRDSIIEDEGLISLLHKLNFPMSDTSRRIIIEAISECFNDETRPSPKACDILIPQIVDLLKNECNEFVVNAICKAIVYLCTENNVCIKAFLDLETKTRLTHLLTHQSEMVVTSALRAIRCLVLPKVLPNQPNNATNSVHPINARECHDEDRPSPRRVSRDEKDPFSEALESTKVFSTVDRPLLLKDQNTSTISSPMRQKVDVEEWMLSPLTSAFPPQSHKDLCELDFITCQNVEMFKATEDDTNDREAAAGSATIGQVGLRCIHCGQSPFARAQFSTVFPGSISLLPASLRHMADMHFQKCERTPYETRKRIHDLCMTKQNYSDKYALKKLCVDLCQNVNVVNRQPQRSGLELATASQKKTATPPRSIVPVSLFHPLHGAIISHNIPSNTTHSTPPRLQTIQSPPRGNLSASNKDLPIYLPDHKGLWRCRDCLFAQHTKVDYAIWNGEGPPPTPFRLKHKQCCPHVLMRQFYRGSSTGLMSEPGALCKEINTTTVFSKQNGISPQATRDTCRVVDNARTDPKYQKNASPCTPKGGERNFSTSFSTLLEQDLKQDLRRDQVVNTKELHFVLSNAKGTPLDDNQVLSSPVKIHGKKNPTKTLSALTPAHLNLDYEKEAKTTDLLRPGDKNMITDFAFFAICQYKSCKYSNVRDGKRRGVVARPVFKENYPGFQCIHCVHGNQPRKFFFSKVERLSNGLHEMTSHISKCKHCPPDIKVKLADLKNLRQSQLSKLVRGSQKVFFKKVWERLHGKQALPTDLFQPRCIAEADDKERFDEFECHVRKGIQIFCADKFDVSFWKASIRKLNIEVGQVGLRCLYCARTQTDTVDLDATIFPTKIENIRDDMMRLHQRHSPKCKSVPKHIKANSCTAKTPPHSVSSQASNEQYVNWAKKFGLINSENDTVIYKSTQQQRVILASKSTSSQDNATKSGTFAVPKCSSFDETLPEPPLERFDEMYSTNIDPNSTDISSLSNTDNTVREIQPISSVNSVTSCLPPKRKYDDAIEDEESQPNPKRHCAV